MWAWRNTNGLNPNTYSAGSQVIGTGWNEHWSTPWRLKFADINNDRRHEIISLDFNGDVRAFRNVNGLNGFPYTEPARRIANGFNHATTFFAEVFA